LIASAAHVHNTYRHQEHGFIIDRLLTLFTRHPNVDDPTSQTALPSLADHGAYGDPHLQAPASLLHHVLLLTDEYLSLEHSRHHRHATATTGVAQSVEQLALV
jgi:hypothetical protein